MRILLEPSDYKLFNVGDIAVLEVALTRLSALWQDAAIAVLTDTPHLLPADHPSVKPLSGESRQVWFGNGYLTVGAFTRRFGKPLWLTKLERRLRRHWPTLPQSIIRTRMRMRGRSSAGPQEFLRAVTEADLVVVAGMGGITDAFEDFALNLLDALGLAIQQGKPTAMFSQGIGPIESPELRARASAVLPFVDFIALREGRTSAPLLHGMGVSPQRIMTTGDDAIETAYQLRTDRLGEGLGVNIRAATYSGVDGLVLDRLRSPLLDAVRMLNAPIVPLPISRHPGEEDALTIRQLFAKTDAVSNWSQDLDTPQSVIERIQRCRVAVAGSYHCAVFALAQGTPAICLINSDYYRNKFIGLAEQFGTGCDLVFLNDPELSAKLTEALWKAWESADEIRPRLLEAAARQVSLGHAAYRRLYDLVGSKSATTNQIRVRRSCASAASG